MRIPIKYSISHKLTQYKFYWLMRNNVRKVSFFFWKVIHGIKSTSKEDFSKLSILKDLTKASLRQLLFAILTAILLHLLNILIAPYLIALGLKIPKDSAYTDFFAAIAGIGGHFYWFILCCDKYNSKYDIFKSPKQFTRLNIK